MNRSERGPTLFKWANTALTTSPLTSHSGGTGGHNNNEEEEGKGRSTKRPRERSKFQIFPMVVALLSLEQWRNAHSTNQPDVNHCDRLSQQFLRLTQKASHYFWRLGDSVELICKPKEVAVWPDCSDLSPSAQTHDRTRRVRTLLSVITYLLSLGMDQLVWYVYSTNSSRSRSQFCSQLLASRQLSIAKSSLASGRLALCALRHCFKLSNATTVGKFWNLIFRVGASRSFPPLYYVPGSN